jgi:hypothetical protein
MDVPRKLIPKEFRKYIDYYITMPATEAQLKATKKWREKNKDAYIQGIYNWCEINIDKKRAYARKYATKKQLWIVACRELMHCLL